MESFGNHSGYGGESCSYYYKLTNLSTAAILEKQVWICLPYLGPSYQG